MTQRCSICSHPGREAIDTALIRGEAYRGIAKQFECSEASMYRHKKNCIKAAIEIIQADLVEQTAQIVGESEEKQKHFAWNALAEMKWLHEEVRAIYKEAKQGHDYKASLQALGEVRQQTKLFSELLQGNEPGQAEKLEQEWVAIREIIFEELEPYPEIRLAIARRLRALRGGHDHESDGQFFEAPASDRTG
jgi:hypothetical protein